MYEQARADIEGWASWHVDTDAEGRERWMLAYDQDWTEVKAEALVDEVRERKIDWTGRNKSGYRMSVHTELTITVRTGYRGEVTLSDPIIVYKGKKSAIRDTLRWIAGGHHLTAARFDLEDRLRKIEVPMAARLDCFDEDEAKHLQNLYWLYERYAKN